MSLKVLVLASEAAPLVKVGGLGDVVGALPSALRTLGHDVRVALPAYPVAEAQAERYGLQRVGRTQVVWSGHPVPVPIGQATVSGVPHYLLGGPYVPRDNRVYGSGIDEDGPKYIFYSMAALALCRELDWQPDVVHAHDSHPGAAVYWLGAKGKRDPFWRRTATVVTIHNLPFQNNHAGKYLAAAGLRPSRDPRLPWWAKDGLMGLALAYADEINAVSPGYAQEIMGEEYGAGLDGLLRLRAANVSGILNGLDYEKWDPMRDPALATPFDADTLARRADTRAALQHSAGLIANPNIPVIGVVSRLDHQKGFDIAAPAVRAVLKDGAAQFVLLGAGAEEIQAPFEALAAEFPGRASVNLGFNAPLAGRIYGGCDVFLMPSRYEPCGTSQMVALRYGAVPLVRATGGLRDTVQHYRRGSGTGFVFHAYNSEALLRTLRRALAVFEQKDEWRALQKRGMAVRFTWARAAADYGTLYNKALEAKRKRRS